MASVGDVEDTRNHKHVKILNKETVYQGFFHIDKYTLRYCRYDGTWTDPFERELFERGDAAAVLLYDPDLDKLVLIEQFRAGALDQIEKKGSPWLIETVAGMIDANQTAVNTIVKETQEEAGLKIQDTLKIAEYYVSPGGTTEKIHLFCARVDATEAGGVHGLAAEHEDIKVIILNRQEAFEAVSTGKINNASTIIALQWLEINQKYLKHRWKR